MRLTGSERADHLHHLIHENNVTSRDYALLFNFSLNEAFNVLLETWVEDRMLSPDKEVAPVTLYSTLIAIGTAANLLICYVVLRKPQMRTPRNLYVVNLAFSDLTMCTICMPFTLLYLLNRSWTLGPIWCKLVPVIQGTNIMVSSGTIAAIAVDRFCTIVRVKRSRGGERRRTLFSILAVWLASLAVTTPVFLFQTVEQVRLGDLIVLYEKCIEHWPLPIAKHLYSLGLLLVQCVGPLLVVSVCHARISTYLRLRLETQRITAFHQQRARRDMERNRRTTLLLSSIALAFAISWFPLNVFTLLTDLHPHLTDPETLYLGFAGCHVLAMTSVCSNPILYGWLNTNIRHELVLLLHSCTNAMHSWILGRVKGSNNSTGGVEILYFRDASSGDKAIAS